MGVHTIRPMKRIFGIGFGLTVWAAGVLGAACGTPAAVANGGSACCSNTTTVEVSCVRFTAADGVHRYSIAFTPYPGLTTQATGDRVTAYGHYGVAKMTLGGHGFEGSQVPVMATGDGFAAVDCLLDSNYINSMYDSVSFTLH